MNKVFWYLFIIWMLLTSNGCIFVSRGPLFSEAKAPPPGYALVYLYRQDSPPKWRTPDIFMNDLKILDLKNRGYSKLYLTGGSYKFSSIWALDTGVPDQSLVIELEGGKEYFIRLHTLMKHSSTNTIVLPMNSPPGVTTYSSTRYDFQSSLERVSREQALAEISALTYVPTLTGEVYPSKSSP